MLSMLNINVDKPYCTLEFLERAIQFAESSNSVVHFQAFMFIVQFQECSVLVTFQSIIMKRMKVWWDVSSKAIANGKKEKVEKKKSAERKEVRKEKRIKETNLMN